MDYLKVGYRTDNAFDWWSNWWRGGISGRCEAEIQDETKGM